MNSRKLLSLAAVLAAGLFWAVLGQAAEPLRVFIRAGVKTHGPGQHDHPRFLSEWTPLLSERGIKVSGDMKFPSAAQLEQTDVLIIFAADGMKIVGEDRQHFESFLRQGGGFVVIHDGVVSGEEHAWAKQIQGGAWIWPKDAPEKKPTRWLEALVGLYFVDNEHPITRGVSNFDWKDEIYYDLDMADDVHVLASSFHDVHTIAPQLWTYEKTLDGGTKPYRAFVSLPGHEYASFQTPHYRALLLRGIAWAGRRDNVDAFCSKEELGSLRYPPGGPTLADQAVKQFSLHPEFQISLTVDENLAEKVMSIEWDEKGRLWVAETPEYPGGRDVNKNDLNAFPNRRLDPEHFPVGGKEPRKARDRISILEDTNGDGVMDKKTVFYEGLELVTSLVPYKDGVVVSQAPDMYWIRDTDGDGRADKVETIQTGWGTMDTHAVTSNLRWGPDGWIYGSVGYSRGRVRSPMSGKDFGDIAAGVYRFKPDGSALEQVAAGGCNQWGCEITPDFEILFTTATCGEPICHVVIPEKFLARGSVGGHRAYASIIEENKIYPPIKQLRQPYVQIDWVGAWTAAAGSCVYDGGAWPGKWEPDEHYSFFLSEATMQIFHHEFLDPNGSTYKGRKEEGRKETHFLTSQDYWFRPIHSRVGPDGAMYLVDFYNQIAVHNDTRGPKVGHGAHNAATRPDRDHHFTRVYRIQHKEARALPPYTLDRQNPSALVKMLEHPNGWVRTTANRLLNEAQPVSVVPELVTLARTGSSRYGRLQALYTLNNLGKLDDTLLLVGLNDTDGAVRKNAAKLAAERESNSPAVKKAVQAMLNDPDGRARIDAILALGSFPPSRDIAEALVAVWPAAATDKYLQSAIIGSAVAGAGEALAAAFQRGSASSHDDFVRHLVRNVALKTDRDGISQLVRQLSRAEGDTSLKASALQSLSATYKGEPPIWGDELQAALKTLLGSSDAAVASAVIPLVARWDVTSAMAADLKPLMVSLRAKLVDTSLSDEARNQTSINLLSLRHMDKEVVPVVAKLLEPGNSATLQKRVSEALGAIPDPDVGAVLVKAFPNLSGEPQDVTFAQILKRADWSAGFLEAIHSGGIDWRALGPAAVFRLRSHPDRAVAALAVQVFDELRGPSLKEKDKLIAEILPAIDKPGDLANGRKIFEANCQTCHKYKEQGRDLAPDLTGMGVHGSHELLVHILDPNRVVEDNFIASSIETTDNESFDGIVVSENSTVLKLRNASGDLELQKKSIRSRQKTGRSLMPEGFEALGAESLRDLMAYLTADDGKYRVIDLRPAFTADSTQGIYLSRASPRESLHFRKFGLVRVGEIPFDIVHPSKSLNGNNLLVLKSRNGITRDFPQTVEVPVDGLRAQRLHVLGNVAGWGYPGGGENTPVARFTISYADNTTETFTLTNGIHVVDYINPALDCPGSKKVDDVVTDHQIRLLTQTLKGQLPMRKLTIESFNNGVAATFAAITAELAVNGPYAAAQSGVPDAPPVRSKFKGQFQRGDAVIGVAMSGGGSSHDFAKWWETAEIATLNSLPGVKAVYSDNPNDLLDAFEGADVLFLSHNQPTPNPAVRKGILEFLDSGRGAIISHAGNWYNWPDWPEYNRVIGGGARGHDRLGEFEVTVTNPSHPLMKGVPATFKITDELYYFMPLEGTEREVLATGKSPLNGKVYPVVFVTKNEKVRIVNVTLGHDGRAHDLEAYKAIVSNSVRWVAEKSAR